MIRKATRADIDKILALANTTRANMIQNGLHQWEEGYPNKAIFLSDLEKSGLYVFVHEGKISGSISILHENEEAYKEISWLKEKSLVIHRVIVNPNSQRMGIGFKLFEHAKQLGLANNYESVKIDTHPDNLKMQGLIKKTGYEYIGFLKGIYRLAYELVL